MERYRPNIGGTSSLHVSRHLSNTQCFGGHEGFRISNAWCIYNLKVTSNEVGEYTMSVVERGIVQ